MNPPVIIQRVTYNNKEFNVIQDAQIIGGSKSRAIHAFIQNHDDREEFVYAGPATGYAQYALAYCAKSLNKKATIFLSSCPKTWDTIPTQGAIKNGASINKLSYLAEAQSAAEAYCNDDPTKFLCPFGMDSQEFHDLFVQKLKEANMPDIGNASIWITVGSGTLLRVLLEIYPHAKFNCVKVGKNIWEDQYKPEDWRRMKIYASHLKFTQNVAREDNPPYNTVKNYDAKLWRFVKKLGEPGDYIFNVAGDN